MTFRLCYHLDERGRPCNRKTMRPFSFCELHREAPVKKPSRPTAEYQRNRKRKLAQAGMIPGWEAA